MDYIIVGGGRSGLMAARRLYEAGSSIALLEARDRLGGRTQTQEFSGSYFELGAQWIGPDQKRINSPGQAIKNGSKMLIIGRSITQSGDPINSIRNILQDIEKHYEHKN